MSVSATRALAALQGLAIGDALGMPTQSMPRGAIERRYGRIVGFTASGPDQPIAPNMRAGSITDDTEQAILIAAELVAGGGHIRPLEFARALSKWEERMRAKGSRDLLGPSTKRAIELIDEGHAPETTGKTGTTNGAAMRVAPVGIAVPSHDLVALLDIVEESALVTHHTSLGVSSAAAVAAAVSAGVDGADLSEAIELSIEAARIGVSRGQWIAGGDIADRIGYAIQLMDSCRADRVIDVVSGVIGTSVASQESVVAAFALAWRYRDNPPDALLAAANAGGDTDTVAAIAGAILGATSSQPWEPQLVSQIEEVNHLELERVARDLLAIRSAQPALSTP